MTTLPETEPNPNSADLDPDSMAAIRNLLKAETEVKPPPVSKAAVNNSKPVNITEPVKERKVSKAKAAFAPLADPEPQAHDPRREKALSKSSKADAKAAKRAEKAQAKAIARASRTGESILDRANAMLDRAKAKVLAYRPTPKHIVLASLTLLIVFRPWLVLGILFLSLFILTAIFLIFGYDGLWLRAMGLARWYARRSRTRSAEIHRKLDNFAMKWDAMLDRFPEGSVDGLYLPDFGDMAEAEARHDAVLDRRFDSLRKNEA